jgi:hypothetical protein
MHNNEDVNTVHIAQVEEPTAPGDGNMTNNTMIKCLYFNARSIMNKIDELRCYIVEESPDVIFITETWIKEDTEDIFIHLQGYKSMRKDRSGRIGGGCMLFHKEDLTCVRDLQISHGQLTETIWCKLKCNTEVISIGLCYRSPSCTVSEEQEIFNEIRQMGDSNNEKLLLGDLILSGIVCSNFSATGNAEEFVNLTQDCFLQQLVTSPTRGDNILDLVFTSNESLIDNLMVCEPFGSSDHNLIKFDIMAPSSDTTWNPYFRDFKRVKYRKMRKFISEAIDVELLQESTVEGAWCKIKSAIDDAIELYVPLKKRSTKKQPRWWNSTVERARKHKLVLWKKYKTSGDLSDYWLYKRAQNSQLMLLGWLSPRLNGKCLVTSRRTQRRSIHM